MKKFQIKFTDKHGFGHFLYFDADEKSKEKIACETANQDLLKRRQQYDLLKNTPFYHPYKPKKTVEVVEYDNVKKATKRGGIKFKISLCFVTATINGQKIASDWYEPVGSSEKTKKP